MSSEKEKKSISRRDFMGKGLAWGAVATIAPYANIIPFSNRDKHSYLYNDEQNKTIKKIRTCCVPSCAGQGCGINAFVQDGKLIKVEAGEFLDDPKMKRICLKGMSLVERTYHSERLQYPMKRIGKRGEGKWRRISWDEALDTIADKIKSLKDKYGGDSLVFMPVGGGTSTVVNMRMGWRLANLLDAYAIASISLHADLAVGDLITRSWKMGTPKGSLMNYTEPADYVNSKLIILWGENTPESRMMDTHFIFDAIDKGAKLIVIDPRFTPAASKADQWIPIKPGTDGALALAMMNVILKEKLQDEDFLKQYTVSPLFVRSDNGQYLREKDIVDSESENYMVWDETSSKLSAVSENTNPTLRKSQEVLLKDGKKVKCTTAFALLEEEIKKYTPEKAEKITEIPSNTIRALALEYAKTKPSLIRYGRSLNTYSNGHTAARSIITLGAFTGNIGNSGGGVLHSGGSQAIGGSAMAGLKMKGFTEPTGNPLKVLPGLHLTNVPEVIDKAKFLWVSGKNPINQSPHQNKFLNEILPKYEFFVVMDQFMTPTAEYADIVLPACMWFERTDLAMAVHYYLQLQQKVIEPMYEAKPDMEVFGELGKRLGFEKYFDKTVEEWIEYLLDNPKSPELNGITLEKLKKGACRLNVPYPYIGWKDKKFYTDSERLEFYVEWLKDLGEELPFYIDPIEASVNNPLHKKYPLMFQQGHTRYYAHSQFGSYCPSLLELNPKPLLRIHPKDAKTRNIKTSDVVTAFNDRGKLECEALVTEEIIPGTIHVPEGWWPRHYHSGHHNCVTNDNIVPASFNNKRLRRESNSTFYDTLVEVKKS